MHVKYSSRWTLNIPTQASQHKQLLSERRHVEIYIYADILSQWWQCNAPVSLLCLTAHFSQLTKAEHSAKLPKPGLSAATAHEKRATAATFSWDKMSLAINPGLGSGERLYMTKTRVNYILLLKSDLKRQEDNTITVLGTTVPVVQ